ncbi:MAG: ABC transporter permease [Coriobacteriales bacterium]|jgi:peptide/nickel transport system permease protein|nr:ABC transporter permease [Coriobacteriales bacterium]
MSSAGEKAGSATLIWGRRHWGLDARIGMALVATIAGLSLLSLAYTPYPSEMMIDKSQFLAPSLSHPLGTDSFGRDVFSRIMVGGRYTLLVAASTVLGSALIGSVIGLTIGYIGGLLSDVVMRIMDALSAFPGILLALIMMAVLPTSDYTIILALLILFVPGYTRIMRSSMLQYRNLDFVDSAKIMGAGSVRIIIRQILPNLLPVLLSALVIGFSNAILAEAAMSYLGFGIQPPAPSWGRMLAESQNYLFNAPWCSIAPGLVIITTVSGFHFLGEGIRKRFC